MSVGVLTALVFGFMILGLVSGLGLSFVLGGIGVIFAWLLMGSESLYLIAQTAFTTQTSFTLVCLPMFIFVGYVLEKAGIAPQRRAETFTLEEWAQLWQVFTREK